MLQFPYPPPPDMPDIPPPSPVFLFMACLVAVLLAVEMLLAALPEGWRHRVNQVRFGPRWKERATK